MTKQHPITPPLKVIQEWMFDLHFSLIPHPDYGEMDAQPHWIELVERAAQWGADQELEACCQWLDIPNNRSDRGDGWLMPGRLRRARRPKPPSLKEQALKALFAINDPLGSLPPCHYDTIRRALEQLND